MVISLDRIQPAAFYILTRNVQLSSCVLTAATILNDQSDQSDQS